MNEQQQKNPEKKERKARQRLRGEVARKKQQFKKPVLEMIPSLAINWPTISEKIKCPALIMTADQKKGAIISPEILSELMHNHPNWESTYYEDSGHNIQRDQFELSKKAIAAFLKKVYRD